MSKSEIRELYDDKRKLNFLKQLSMTSNVAGSAKVAGIAVSTVYYWREQDPEFYDQWMMALAAGYELLEMEMLDRARNGTPRDIYYHGKRKATVRDYNDAMALRLLTTHKEMVARARAERTATQEGSSAIRLKLDQRLADMRKRLLNGSSHGSGADWITRESPGGNAP